MIEYGVMKKIWFLVSKIWIKWQNEHVEEDRDVLGERQRVCSSKGLKGSDWFFIVLLTQSLFDLFLSHIYFWFDVMIKVDVFKLLRKFPHSVIIPLVNFPDTA